MENIKLTKKHKCKLLEMCNVLFPEYHSWQFGKMKIAADDELWFYDKQDKNYEFHWFEFCMTYLQFKVLGISDYKATEKFFMRTLFQCEAPHPVDYLYNVFKK